MKCQEDFKVIGERDALSFVSDSFLFWNYF